MKQQPGVIPLLSIGITLACLFLFHTDYFLFSFQIILGMLVLPVLLNPNAKQKGKLRYAVLTFLFFGLALIFQLKVLLFMAWGCFLVFLVEYYLGALGYLPLFFLGSISPALYYVVNIFSFPLRLELSELTCTLFNLAGRDLQNKGSYFILPSGESFHIDQACVGLKMFGTGYIAAVLILAYYQKKRDAYFSFLQLVSAFILMSALLVLSNLIRIMGLVLFHSKPNTLSHEIIGLLSLALYALLPFLLAAKYLKGTQKISVRTKNIYQYAPQLLMVLMIIGSVGFKMIRSENRKDPALERLQVPGFVRNNEEDGVVSFKNDSLLIYVKPAVRAFEGGHPPQICWQASGFDLCDFNEQQLGPHSIMRGTLKKEDKMQYTAWWYDNGQIRTIHEWEWRKRNAAPFRIINVIALDSNTLLREVNLLLEKPLFKP